MILRTRLLISFSFISLLIVLIFGTVAYRITTESTHNNETRVILSYAKSKANELRSILGNLKPTEQSPFILSDNGNSLNYYIVLNSSNDLVAHSPFNNDITEFLNRFGMQKRTKKKPSGALTLNDQKYLWGMAEIPETGNSLILMHQVNDQAALKKIVSVRLIITGAIVFWVAIWGALIVSSIISKRIRKKNAELLHQSLHDSLTELPNRTLLIERLQQAVNYCRQEGKTLALITLSLSRVKEINDTLGHKSGDILLRKIAPRLQDTLCEPDTIARLSGGEFAILLSNIKLENLTVVANKIITAFEAPFTIGALDIQTGVTLGIAIFPDHSHEPDILSRLSEVALHQAKEKGREFIVYTQDSDPHTIDRLTLMAELRYAIEYNGLDLYYQPQIDIASKQVVGVEALVRWHHRERGFIPPDEFIPKAEQVGLIKPLTTWVLEEAIQQLKLWNKQGINLQIAINISQRSLPGRQLATQISDLLDRINIRSCHLELEITESAIMTETESSLTTMHDLKELGVGLSIDDFGTGFSSLSYLKELPIDTLKIDKSFVMSMLSNNDDAVIVRSIIELAHNMGRAVVAEGVESLEMLEKLELLQCDIAQGYYMAKPMPAHELEKWLSESEWGKNGIIDMEQQCDKRLQNKMRKTAS
ncbi:Sensory box/GGDEF family protein [hydrothermal vent metagenome]|uniref:Sensory box/GGDEF family protein n=1 Tax=hydrothermal vent metagenome TaxID=652676 RepID=A0A3B0ZXS4_9ZZZZ